MTLMRTTMRKGALLIVVASLVLLGGGRIFGWGGGGEQPPRDFVTGRRWVVGGPAGAVGKIRVGGGGENRGLSGHPYFLDLRDGLRGQALSPPGCVCPVVPG